MALGCFEAVLLGGLSGRWRCWNGVVREEESLSDDRTALKSRGYLTRSLRVEERAAISHHRS